jgi:hypothetical protein
LLTGGPGLSYGPGYTSGLLHSQVIVKPIKQQIYLRIGKICIGVGSFILY